MLVVSVRNVEFPLAYLYLSVRFLFINSPALPNFRSFHSSANFFHQVVGKQDIWFISTHACWKLT